MILAILQARMSSTRLPGKVLKPLLGEPMLLRQIERIRRVCRIDQLLVATSVDASDDPLAALCERIRVACFRGSLDNVLERFYLAASEANPQPEHVVRLTGDCPLADPELIDAVIEFHLAGGYDYSTNALEATFPDGLDVEVVRFACLQQAWQEATLPSELEHVMPFITRRPERFRIGHFKAPTDLSHLRWTVDNSEDFEFVSRVYEALYPTKPDFTTADILALLERYPELQEINVHIERNVGLKKSLIEDEKYRKSGGEH
jgi:spore coat polysaccharide biosynthesis protein SpsF